MLAAGIEGLYGEPLDEKKSGLIIVSDLIERYRNREEIVSLFNEIAAFCEESGIELYIKYHPRETNKIQTECRIQELSTGVAVEKLYLDFNESKTVVLGNMSTSVLTAKKLGFKTISIMKMNDPQQNIISAYEKIGIEMPVSNNEMLSFIADGLKLRR
ncbi:MAG: alpha-2,8-polysialyltransferase family protein [Ruminococcus sp.]|nr:alpha-2,8-polysialyltransferase family protein [Ruminococcus sp.]